MMSSPKSVFCHANQSLVNFEASSLLKLSCMNPVPASVFINISTHSFISLSSWDVKARIMIDIGQTMSYPTCGPPIPSPTLPRKK